MDLSLSSPPAAKQWIFLQLPTEIRDEIYSLILVEPPRLLRRHRTPCAYSRVMPYWGPRITAYPAWSPLRRCNCAKRRNLQFLLVSRYIEADVARVFWGFNVFSFNGTGQFSRDIGVNLRPERRSLLRHVVIYDKRQDLRSKDESAMGFVPRLDQVLSSHVWDVVFSCDSLQSLHIRPELLMW